MEVKKLPIIISLLLVIVLASACKTRKYATTGNNGDKREYTSLSDKYASLLDVNKRDISNTKLYAFIDEWMGVKYRNGGLDKNGVDCSGFTYLLYRDVYGRTVPRMTSKLIESIKRKYESDLKEGDLVFFDFDGKKFSHVGVYLQNGKFVHASTTRGIVISALKEPWYYKVFSRAGSIN